MASILRGFVELRQCRPQQPPGFLAIAVPAQQHALGEGQFVAVAAGHHVQVDVEHALKGRLTVVDGDVVAIGMQTRYPGRLRDALPESGHRRDGLRRGVGQIHDVLFGEHQGVAPGERPDIQDRQQIVILVHPDGGGVTGDDGAEHAGHAATVVVKLYSSGMGLFGGSEDDLQRRVEDLERRVAALERALNAGRAPRPYGELTETSGSETAAPQSGVTEMVRQLAIGGNKIAAIKLLRDETGMGLREAKNAVDRLA